ncbi:MAG: hypothetical protein KIT37_13585 [Steroidobacteraceae bacterium]|nr:hypothetical protein [Steroidobacteraceae bacterium]
MEVALFNINRLRCFLQLKAEIFAAPATAGPRGQEINILWVDQGLEICSEGWKSGVARTFDGGV